MKTKNYAELANAITTATGQRPPAEDLRARVQEITGPLVASGQLRSFQVTALLKVAELSGRAGFEDALSGALESHARARAHNPRVERMSQLVASHATEPREPNGRFASSEPSAAFPPPAMAAAWNAPAAHDPFAGMAPMERHAWIREHGLLAYRQQRASQAPTTAHHGPLDRMTATARQDWIALHGEAAYREQIGRK